MCGAARHAYLIVWRPPIAIRRSKSVSAADDLEQNEHRSMAGTPMRHTLLVAVLAIKGMKPMNAIAVFSARAQGRARRRQPRETIGRRQRHEVVVEARGVARSDARLAPRPERISRSATPSADQRAGNTNHHEGACSA